MEKQIHILDTTLRDGSYTVTEPFTASDTATICKALDEAGIEFIEIGNGAGLNAKKLGWAHIEGSDEEHMQAARGAVQRAKYGFFCVPGVARLEDIDLAHQYGVGFLRIGIYPGDVSRTKEFVARAKSHGIFVSVNIMKSYSVPPNEFAKYSELIEDYGADVVYIVDSAGGMFPEEVLAYYRAIRQASEIKIGFHGHDNLGLAIANSIVLADAGASFIDVSLQGLGRSSGNTVSEVLIAALKKRGYKIDIDLLKVMELGKFFVQPLLQTKGREPLDTIAGYADYAFFESSYISQIIETAKKHKVHPALLMIRVCKKNKLRPLDLSQLNELANEIKASGIEGL